MTGSPNGMNEARAVWKGTAADEAALSGARVTIDLGALQANWRTLAERAKPAACAAVVKANAYGIGLEKAAGALRAAGARTFFVALPAEGAVLRESVPDARIFVLNGVFAEDAAFYREFDLVPFLSSPDEVEDWAHAARRMRQRLPAAINVDTGMNRLGLTPERARRYIEEGLPEGIEPVLFASHFACADTPEHPMNGRQSERFAALAAAVRDHWPRTRLSLANSAATLDDPRTHYDLVRPGIAVYGGRATTAHPPLAPVATLESRILQIRDVPAGESVGYGAAETVARDSRVAIASIGYADGYLRAKGGTDAKAGAPVGVAGTRCRLVGRVSMDLVAIDVTDVPAGSVRRGDWVELFGGTIPIDEAADAAGTISYELLTGLSRRAARSYLEPSEREV